MTRAGVVLLALLAGCRDAPPERAVEAPAEVAAVTTPAFPGADGSGAAAAGGRGGAILRVTTLDDGGPGSLRAAVEAPGPRVILFGVAGTIALARPLVVRHPRVTIVELSDNLVSRYRRGLRLNDLDDGFGSAPGGPPSAFGSHTGVVVATRNRFVAPRKRCEEIVVDDTVTNAVLVLDGNLGPRGVDWDAVTLENPGGRGSLDRLGGAPEPTRPAGRPFDLVRVGALPRDACDARLVAEVEGGGPDVVDDPSEVGGWPVLAPGTLEPDGDRDGVPDAWEAAHGKDPAVFDAWADPDGDGWASLEAWLAERAGP